MTVCTHCGHSNSDQSQFCTNPSCGAFLSWDGARRPDAEPEPEAVGQRTGAHLELAPAELRVAPGDRVAAAVTVRNTGTVVERFRMSVVGDAARWARVEPAEIVAYPEGTPTCTVEFAPPAPASRAGTAAFEVHADSIVNPGLRAGASGALTVLRLDAVSAGLSPQTTRGGAVTTHQLQVDNQGNAAAQVALAASDPEAVLAFELPPQVVVEPGRVSVPVTVRATPPWWGRPREVPFRVLATPDGSRPVAVDGLRVVQPRLGIWQLAAVAAALVAVVALVVVLVNAFPSRGVPPGSAAASVDPNSLLVQMQVATNFSPGGEVTVMAGGRAQVALFEKGVTWIVPLTPEELGTLRDNVRSLDLGVSQERPPGDYLEITLIVNGRRASNYVDTITVDLSVLPPTWSPVVMQLGGLIDRAEEQR